ncbi:cyclin-K-like isoform X2 [Artemia franciscana]|uniref:Cyclin-like domain-containing protein n=1 Tax=Artemia franciscana TaxID=6661 RepID=A0AA88H676_ARTSF|nr:hypothetical protein QYM36_016020 [Artemia franciscana]
MKSLYLINMPCWYYDKKELRKTPSAMAGLDLETEARYRREGAKFIMDLGNNLGLRYDTMASGIVYFHRYYMFHTFQEFPRYVTACCCLFLAGKVEETPKKCKDVIKHAKTVLTEKQYATFGEDPKEEIMTLERILLQTIQFDLQVEHPYRYLLSYGKSFKVDQEKKNKIIQMAWTFVNDSLCTTLCLQWEPEIIAVALMYLACKLQKCEILDWEGKIIGQRKWWEKYVEEVTQELLEDICHQVLDLYQNVGVNDRPDSPTVQKPPSQPQTPVQPQAEGKRIETIYSQVNSSYSQTQMAHQAPVPGTIPQYIPPVHGYPTPQVSYPAAAPARPWTASPAKLPGQHPQFPPTASFYPTYPSNQPPRPPY